MVAKFVGSYRKAATGTVVYRYAVTGTEAELASYAEAQGDQFRADEETGTPFFFTTRFAGPSCKLIITKAGRVIADMSAFDAAASLAKQYGGNFGQELAQTAAAQLLGNLGQVFSVAPAKPEVAPEVTPESEAGKKVGDL